MSRHQNDVYIQCPFYITTATKSITCEGITDNSTTKLLFDNPQLRDDFCQEFCICHFRKCKIYKMLEAKYEDE